MGEGYKPAAVKVFKCGGELLTRFFFIWPPTATQSLERHGHCQWKNAAGAITPGG